MMIRMVTFDPGRLTVGDTSMVTATSASTPDGNGLLAEQIRLARHAHAERIAAIGSIRDAASMRLLALKEELTPCFLGHSAASSIVDLTLVSGDPPRLWIDMTTYVTMAPDPSTYRVQRDTICDHVILAETRNRRDAVEVIVGHVAHHLVEREKQIWLLGEAGAAPGGGTKHSGSMLLAWLSGLTFGACLVAALLQWVLK
jgi:hypothetical protein